MTIEHTFGTRAFFYLSKTQYRFKVTLALRLGPGVEDETTPVFAISMGWTRAVTITFGLALAFIAYVLFLRAF